MKRFLLLTMALTALAMPVHAHRETDFVHRQHHVDNDVRLMRACIRQLWASDNADMPLDVWEPMAKICLSIVRESQTQN